MAQISIGGIHNSSVVMLGLIVAFAFIHSGGAAIRSKAEKIVGPRVWRLIFASASIPSAALLIGYFLIHRYDGIRLWNVQGLPGIQPLVWILTAISFLFIYPATYNLLEIPAILKPKQQLYTTGIIRISRHPQAIGQILWCISHQIWIGSSFTLVTSIGLIAHHLFAVWHGDRRLKVKFGNDFEKLLKSTSVVPFLAIIQGRQKIIFQEFLRPSQLGIAVTISILWWSHRFITPASKALISSQLNNLLT